MSWTPFVQADLQNRLSSDGVTYRVADAPPTALGDVVVNTRTLIEEHCRPRYSVAQLAASEWVHQRSADIGAFLLCERLGNPVPPGVAGEYDRTMKRLELVRLGSLRIPDAATLKTEAPVVSNVRIRLDPFPRTVVERNRSTGVPAGYPQHADVLDFLDYSI